MDVRGCRVEREGIRACEGVTVAAEGLPAVAAGTIWDVQRRTPDDADCAGVRSASEGVAASRANVAATEDVRRSVDGVFPSARSPAEASRPTAADATEDVRR